MSDELEPYISRNPNDLIQAKDWNDIQIEAKKELRQKIKEHNHTGGAQGVKLPGDAIDPGSSLSVAKLTVNARDVLAEIDRMGAVPSDDNVSLALKDRQLRLRGDVDANHGLVYGGFPGKADPHVDGPALYGNGGGLLGTIYGGERIALKWDTKGVSVSGGQGDVTSTEGDFRIGNDKLGLKIGVALDGSHGCDVRIRAMGGLADRLMLGAGNTDCITMQHGNVVIEHNVGIGTSDPKAKLDVRVAGEDHGDVDKTEGDFRIGNDTIRLKVGVALSGDVRIRAIGGSNRLMLGASGSDSITVCGDNVGIGTHTPRARLEIAGGAVMPSWGKDETSGILFPPDPGGGNLDRAWVRYYPRTGESMTLEIGVSNDSDDHISLVPSGGVAIGSNDAGKYRLNIAARDAEGQDALAICGNTDIRNKRLQTLMRFGNGGDYQLVHNPKGYFGRNTLALHCEAHDALGFYSSNWTPLLEVAGGGGGAWIRGPLVVNQRSSINDPSITIGSSRSIVGAPDRSYALDGICGRPNLWLDAEGTGVVRIKKGFETQGFDVAERFPARDRPEAGDVMVFDETDQHIRRCDHAVDKRAVGIVSGEAAFILGIEETETPIALCGRVPCKVDADIAPIVAGDLLTTSPTPGHAQKAIDPNACAGAIIGKALTSLTGGRGEVLALVHVR